MDRRTLQFVLILSCVWIARCQTTESMHMENAPMTGGGMHHGHGDDTTNGGMHHHDDDTTDGGMHHHDDDTTDDGMHHGHHSDMGHDGMGHMGGHNMFFRLGNEVQLIFEEWMTDDDESLGLAVLYVILAAIVFEGLKALRDRMSVAEARRGKQKREWSYELNNKKSDPVCSCCLFFLHILQAILHTIQVFISMCLMMVFMTLNAWLCTAVCVGAGIGYLIFGKCRRSATEDAEYCH